MNGFCICKYCLCGQMYGCMHVCIDGRMGGCWMDICVAG